MINISYMDIKDFKSGKLRLRVDSQEDLSELNYKLENKLRHIMDSIKSYPVSLTVDEKGIYRHYQIIELPNMVEKPHHYIGNNGLEVEQILQEFIPRYEDSYIAHRVSSALEYLLRSPLKNGLEDIKKAKENLEQVLRYVAKDVD